jgi:hypothetical protein
MHTPPIVDRRTSEEFAAKVREILRRELPETWRHMPRQGDAANALIDIFGQMCGTVVSKLNQVPGKNLLAFLDLQGVSARPAQAARAPLTFFLVAKHQGHVKVPARSQVTAQPEKNDQQPVIFETEREFVITSAQLVFAGTKDGEHDAFSNYSSILPGDFNAPAVSIFTASNPIEHLLFIDLGLALPVTALKEVRLNFQLVAPQNPSSIAWFRWEILQDAPEKSNAKAVTPVRDETNGLTGNGAIVFQNLPPVPKVKVADTGGQWLVCRVVLPLGSASGMIPPGSVPALRSLEITADFERKGLVPDGAFLNQLGLDVSKDFFPFGLHPKFGDTFYLANREAFSISGALITLHFTLVNPEQEGPDMRIAPVRAYAVKLKWELGDGKTWIELGTAESAHEVHEESGFSDTTRAFTKPGAVTFRVPRSVTPIAKGGINSVWVRARIIAGDYGVEVRVETPAPSPPPRNITPLGPPCVHSVQIDYALTTSSTRPALLAYNDFRYVRVDAPAEPIPMFQTVTDTATWFYLGFDHQGKFSDRSMSMYVAVANPNREGALVEVSGAKLMLLWEYWNGSAWTRWTVLDDTEGFAHSGIIRFLAPADFTPHAEFGRTLHWARVRFRDKTAYVPQVRRIVLNTTIASQTVTITDEILGTSLGSGDQTFEAARPPILEGQQLEVRELMIPSARELSVIAREEGTDTIRQASGSEGHAGQVWVRWHEVANFNASNKDDRHYTIDRATGKVTFGDGVRGGVPPPLDRNILMRRYQTGGGAIGNRKPGTITQLNTAIPYVDHVTNYEPASGGADAEEYKAMLERAPRLIRHRWRAVTAEDYEDLALLASAEVARARCLPLRDLSKGFGPAAWRPGAVTVIIAPVSFETGSLGDQKSGPMPSLELIERVKNYLDARRPREADLIIVGPEYVLVNIETEVTIAPDAAPNDVELAVSFAITRFLHPITGKRDGSGWEFGEEPNRSELFAVIEDVPGVDHVRELQLTTTEPRRNALRERQFLIWGAEPKVTVTLEI